MLTEAILKKFQKRNYPHYNVIRSSNIFASRAQFTAYDYALDINAQVEKLMDEGKWAEAWDICEYNLGFWETLIQNDLGIQNNSSHFLRRFSAGIR